MKSPSLPTVVVLVALLVVLTSEITIKSPLVTVDNVGYDVITDVATVPGGPYLLVGCESGNCKVIHVQIRAGVEPVIPREGGTMESVLLLQPYQSRFFLSC